MPLPRVSYAPPPASPPKSQFPQKPPRHWPFPRPDFQAPSQSSLSRDPVIGIPQLAGDGWVRQRSEIPDFKRGWALLMRSLRTMAPSQHHVARLGDGMPRSGSPPICLRCKLPIFSSPAAPDKKRPRSGRGKTAEHPQRGEVGAETLQYAGNMTGGMAAETRALDVAGFPTTWPACVDPRRLRPPPTLCVWLRAPKT